MTKRYFVIGRFDDEGEIGTASKEEAIKNAGTILREFGYDSCLVLESTAEVRNPDPTVTDIK